MAIAETGLRSFQRYRIAAQRSSWAEKPKTRSLADISPMLSPRILLADNRLMAGAFARGG